MNKWSVSKSGREIFNWAWIYRAMTLHLYLPLSEDSIIKGCSAVDSSGRPAMPAPCSIIVCALLALWRLVPHVLICRYLERASGMKKTFYLHRFSRLRTACGSDRSCHRGTTEWQREEDTHCRFCRLGPAILVKIERAYTRYKVWDSVVIGGEEDVVNVAIVGSSQNAAMST